MAHVIQNNYKYVHIWFALFKTITQMLYMAHFIQNN